MHKRWYLLLALGVLAASFIIVFYYSVTPDGVSQGGGSVTRNPRVLESRFYFENQFNRAIVSAEANKAVFPVVPIRAGIIPHDITQGQIIAHFFRELSRQSPRRIILIGPNHYERGGSLVLTTAASWRSGAGVVQADDEMIQWLVEQHYAEEDDAVAIDEHSIAGIVPYISKYLPEAEIVPLILKAEIRLSEVQSLAEALTAIVDEHTVVIAAVDFSHYLSAAEAIQHDQVTEQALRGFDYQNILSFGPQFNDYVDSPPSIALLLYWLSIHDINGVEILEHTNSGLLTGNMTDPVTSYFEVVYY